MSVLDFPTSPTNGQYFSGYIWNEANSTWDSAYAPRAATIPISSPNYIINGAFDINQRNFTSITDNSFGFDRWRQFTTGGTSTYTPQTFALGSSPADGIESRNFARIVTASQSASGHYTQLTQRLEGVRTLANTTVTVSFWAKAGSGTPKLSLEWQQVFGSGGSPSSPVNTFIGQVTLSTSWQRYSLTFSSPSIAGKAVGTNNDDYIQFNFFTSAGADFNSRTGSLGVQNNTFDFWGVQLEAGAAPTEFRRNAPSIQAELAACQRYYFRNTPGPNYGVHGHGYSNTTTGAQGFVFFPVQMRIPPTSLEWSNIIFQVSNGVFNPVTLVQDQTSRTCFNIGMTVTSGTHGANLPGRILNNDSPTAFIGYSAEL